MLIALFPLDVVTKNIRSYLKFDVEQIPIVPISAYSLSTALHHGLPEKLTFRSLPLWHANPFVLKGSCELLMMLVSSFSSLSILINIWFYQKKRQMSRDLTKVAIARPLAVQIIVLVWHCAVCYP